MWFLGSQIPALVTGFPTHEKAFYFSLAETLVRQVLPPKTSYRHESIYRFNTKSIGQTFQMHTF